MAHAIQWQVGRGQRYTFPPIQFNDVINVALVQQPFFNTQWHNPQGFIANFFGGVVIQVIVMSM